MRLQIPFTRCGTGDRISMRLLRPAYLFSPSLHPSIPLSGSLPLPLSLSLPPSLSHSRPVHDPQVNPRPGLVPDSLGPGPPCWTRSSLSLPLRLNSLRKQGLLRSPRAGRLRAHRVRWPGRGPSPPGPARSPLRSPLHARLRLGPECTQRLLCHPAAAARAAPPHRRTAAPRPTMNHHGGRAAMH